MNEEALDLAKNIIKKFIGEKEITVSSYTETRAVENVAKVLISATKSTNKGVLDIAVRAIETSIRFLIDKTFTIDEILGMLSVTAGFMLYRTEVLQDKINDLENLGISMDIWKKIFKQHPLAFGFRRDRLVLLRTEYNLSFEETKRLILMYPKILIVPESELDTFIPAILSRIEGTDDLSQGLFGLETVYSVLCGKTFVPMWEINELMGYLVGKEPLDLEKEDWEQARNAIIEQYPPLDGIELIANFKNREDMNKFLEDQKALHGATIHLEPLNKKKEEDSTGGIQM